MDVSLLLRAMRRSSRCFEPTCQKSGTERIALDQKPPGDWSETLSEMAPYKEEQFPLEFSFRQRDCAEPLLQIADFIGGQRPQRARQAGVRTFALAAFEDWDSSPQILSDLRDAFAEKAIL